MFSTISRYRKLPDTVAIDAQGRLLASKSLRPPPTATGIFFHTVEAVDRLDHLAYKYYKQPRKWWRICDANPEFPSPQALLGKEPVATAQFPLTFAGVGQPPWAGLLQKLGQKIGVEDVRLLDDIQLAAQEQIIGGQNVIVNVERHEQAVTVVYNRMYVSAGELASIILGTGFAATEPENIGRVGKRIVIPPDVIG
jgi:hypothetical protein